MGSLPRTQHTAGAQQMFAERGNEKQKSTLLLPEMWSNNSTSHLLRMNYVPGTVVSILHVVINSFKPPVSAVS